MPSSKKKARIQARKAKKEAQQATSSSDSGNAVAPKQAVRARQVANSSDSVSGNVAPAGGSSCKHIKLPDNPTMDNFKDAGQLIKVFDEIISEYHTFLRTGSMIKAKW